MLTRLESQNIFARVGELHKKAKKGDLSDDELTEYNKIDDCITTAMISAERKLPKKGNRLWTTELGQLVHQARYYLLLL